MVSYVSLLKQQCSVTFMIAQSVIFIFVYSILQIFIQFLNNSRRPQTVSEANTKQPSSSIVSIGTSITECFRLRVMVSSGL